MRNRQRGMTLVETLVAASLSLLLFFWSVRWLMPMMSLQARGLERAELQHQTTRALSLLRSDLLTSNPAGIRAVQSTQEVVVAIQPLGPVSADGNLSWSPTMVLYCYDPAQQTILRRHWQAPADTSLRKPIQMSDDQLIGLVSQARLERVVAANVFHFSVEGQTLPLRVEVGLGSRLDSSRYCVAETFGPRTPTR
ncbi:MAG: prepilin-type N-terminal cleavage/methylation domain-containing protein [Candidatus Eremiobacteraeota bacterium]|nr:prepilin-type N-terminal cleavage/methylation domain-containing protein [Candidatus Eremiobacteraeota bacterium]